MSITSVLNFLSTALGTAGPEIPELGITQESIFAAGPPSPIYDGIFEKSFDGRLPPLAARSPSPSPTASLLEHTPVLSYLPIRSDVSPLSSKLPRTRHQYKELREGHIVSPSRPRRSKLPVAKTLFEGLRFSNGDRRLTQLQPNQAHVTFGTVSMKSNTSVPRQKAVESIEMEELKPVLVNSHEYSSESIPAVEPSQSQMGKCGSRILQMPRQRGSTAAKTGTLRRIESSVFEELENVSRANDLEGHGIDVVSETENDVGKKIVVTAFDTMGLFGKIYDSSSDEEESELRLKAEVIFNNETMAAGRAKSQEQWLPIHSREAIEGLNSTRVRSRLTISRIENRDDDQENANTPVIGEVSESTVKMHPLLSTGAMQAPVHLDQLEPDIFENEMIGLSAATNRDDKRKRNPLFKFKRKPLAPIENDSVNIRTPASLKSQNGLSFQKWKLRAREPPRRVMASIERRLNIFAKIFRTRNFHHDKEPPIYPLFEDSFDDFISRTEFFRSG
ncbi:hypothetical protein POJ06DRAFT_237418 [Lipomyces tetrasporus]|uniref:Uncharacterized protein n=1 Tax=Lipomyces tetrasporus TaxID=54092 RepID=A0AAD7QTM2_9ASCO|nr:uncharacterized protein POJ06DRAFT_237418 [Lipomyces tetrasporus]KAJ8101278.1 hypothetical protein POJ06DRAFT_237418 [Lipomyces tetrasporus]